MNILKDGIADWKRCKTRFGMIVNRRCVYKGLMNRLEPIGTTCDVESSSDLSQLWVKGTSKYCKWPLEYFEKCWKTWRFWT